jgi:MFS family permease
MYILWLYLAISVLCESVATTWQVWFVAKLFSGMGVGSLQFVTPTYVSEVAPVRVRGILLIMYNFWFSVGGFFAPVALQVMSTKDPLNFRTPIYTQWAHIGVMLIIYVSQYALVTLMCRSFCQNLLLGVLPEVARSARRRICASSTVESQTTMWTSSTQPSLIPLPMSERSLRLRSQRNGTIFSKVPME